MENRSQVSLLKVGDRLSETQYYEVVGFTPPTHEFQVPNVVVKNERDFQFTISAKIVQEGIYSANQHTEEKSVTRTELIQIFSQCHGAVFQVNFNKQPKAEDINEAIEAANKGKILPIKDIKKLVKNAYKGEERTLTGYLVSTETGFGRSMVIDLEADQSKSTPEWDSRLRQVDHRTLNWLIYKNVKYVAR